MLKPLKCRFGSMPRGPPRPPVQQWSVLFEPSFDGSQRSEPLSYRPRRTESMFSSDLVLDSDMYRCLPVNVVDRPGTRWASCFACSREKWEVEA